jgi:hypothetical protein
MKARNLVLPLLALTSIPMIADANEPRPRPNVLFSASSALLNAAVARPVDETEPVQDVIQDTPVEVVARTVGTVTAELVPAHRQAVIDLTLGACVLSRTVGSRGTIRIHTFTTTPVSVTRRVVVDETGIRVLAGPCHAHSNTELLSIHSTMDMDRLALCMVERGYWRSKDAAEAETSHKTVRRVAERFDNDLTPVLASASQIVGRELATLKRLGFSLDSLRFQTTATNLEASALIAPASQGPVLRGLMPPALPDADLSVRVHESFFNAVAQAALGNRSFSLDTVAQVYREATRDMLRDARKDVDQAASLKRITGLLSTLAGAEIVITLAKEDPLTVHFGDQEFSIEVHVAMLQQGKERFAGLRHKAVYRLENGKDGVQAVRKKPAQTIADPAQPDMKLAALSKASLLLHQALFAEVFPERLALAPLPANLRLGNPQGMARDGWLTLAWKLAR